MYHATHGRHDRHFSLPLSNCVSEYIAPLHPYWAVTSPAASWRYVASLLRHSLNNELMTISDSPLWRRNALKCMVIRRSSSAGSKLPFGGPKFLALPSQPPQHAKNLGPTDLDVCGWQCDTPSALQPAALLSSVLKLNRTDGGMIKSWWGAGGEKPHPL